LGKSLLLMDNMKILRFFCNLRKLETDIILFTSLKSSGFFLQIEKNRVEYCRCKDSEEIEEVKLITFWAISDMFHPSIEIPCSLPLMSPKSSATPLSMDLYGFSPVQFVKFFFDFFKKNFSNKLFSKISPIDPQREEKVKTRRRRFLDLRVSFSPKR